MSRDPDRKPMKALAPWWRQRVRTVAIAMSAALIVAGCASSPWQAPPPPDAAGNFVPLTLPVIALGDTQEHESTGFPMLDNDSAVDSYVEVAQRPPEAPLFSRRILEWVVESHPAEPVLHLGDLLDMSCRSELRRMMQLEASLGRPGAILPGNHDGLLFGVFNIDATNLFGDAEAQRWNMGCRSPIREGVATLEDARGQAVTKPDFIRAYLDLVGRRLAPENRPAIGNAGSAGRVSWRNPAPASFVEAIEARLESGRFYSSSFIAQKIALPAAPGATRRVKVIGLDTNQLLTIVGVLDTLRRTSPGDIGSVDADQVAAITPWIDEAIRAGDLVVFAGHHNWGQLAPLSRLQLAVLMQRLDHPLVYLSAHTHRGFWAQHSLAGRPLLELNVSSLSDWPIAYRRVSLHYDAQANRIKLVGELLPAADGPARSDADLLLGWTRATCARAGVPVAGLAGEEIAAVRRQKAARGSLWEWLHAQFGPGCESCQRVLFDHAHAYQDQLLATIAQLDRDLGPDTARLHEVELPAACAGRKVGDCATELAQRHAVSLPEHIAGFREKARVVDRVNLHLDDLRDARAKAYMACRAVLGAKTDYDDTPEESTPGRSEAFRTAQDFFRSEATVGMH
jgi:hypothetical protein